MLPRKVSTALGNNEFVCFLPVANHQTAWHMEASPSRFHLRPGKRRFGSKSNSCVSIFSTRMLRGGPRILVHLAGFLVLFTLVVKLTSYGLTDRTYLTTSKGSFWSWSAGIDKHSGSDRPREAWDETDNNATFVPYEPGNNHGGLRIVVFGEDDVATPCRKRGDGRATMPSWTEVICHELSCSSYISFTPACDDISHSMVSNVIYHEAVEQLSNETREESGWTSDYTLQTEMYPVPWNLPDLGRQITTFLSTPIPATPLSDTLWVFSLGTWDVWYLATLPMDQSKPLLRKLSEHVFEQVERLYQSSLKEGSPAWSGVKQGTQTSTLDSDTEASKAASETKGAAASNRTRSENFRIIVPKLFDPTLTPGWRLMRPKLSSSGTASHPMAEQMRNAAALTDEWNYQLGIKLVEWIGLSEPDAADKPIAAKSNADTPARGPGHPLRDAIGYDMPKYIIDTIFQAQFRDEEPADDALNNLLGGVNSTARHDAPEQSLRYEEVTHACIEPSLLDEQEGNFDRDEDQQPIVCVEPHQHLFFTPFTLESAAIEHIAREVAERVLGNKTVRARWDEISSLLPSIRDRNEEDGGDGRPAVGFYRHSRVWFSVLGAYLMVASVVVLTFLKGWRWTRKESGWMAIE